MTSISLQNITQHYNTHYITHHTASPPGRCAVFSVQLAQEKELCGSHQSRKAQGRPRHLRTLKRGSYLRTYTVFGLFWGRIYNYCLSSGSLNVLEGGGEILSFVILCAQAWNWLCERMFVIKMKIIYNHVHSEHLTFIINLVKRIVHLHILLTTTQVLLLL